MSYPKVVVIGAGSIFFGRQAIWQMINSQYLRNGTLALVDTNEQVLANMVNLAKMVVEHEKSPLCIEGSTNRRDVLKDANFVILSFAEKSAYYRDIDCRISEKYGVRMCSGDSIGPGGIFRTMREFPIILECAKDVEELCPDAWVINYINPSAANGIGLNRYAPGLKSFALCDGLHMPHVKIDYALRAGIISDKSEYNECIDNDFKLSIAGVNHFTWMLQAEYKGQNVVPQIAESIRIKAEDELENEGGEYKQAKSIYHEAITYELYKIFGYIPVCTAHTKEYFNYWQGKGVTPDNIPKLSIWEVDLRYEWHKDTLEHINGFLTGKIPVSEYMKTFNPDHATDIIESMVGGLDKKFYISVPNNGAVTNMSDDAFLELLCNVSSDGVKAEYVGEMPRGIRAFQEIVLDTHELTVQAVVACDRELLRRAMMIDPMICSISDADNIIKELLEAEKDILPSGWYS